jgi:carboxylate-amine ligase
MPKNTKNNESYKIDFKTNGFLTLGAEIELQIIDKNSYDLSSKAEELLSKTKNLIKVKPEFYLSTVEINTDKCNTVQEIEQDLIDSLDAIEPISKEVGVDFSTTGCHPFSKYSDCIITPSMRYNELIDRNQWLTKRMTVYGLHVHIGMKSGDDCIKFNNFFLHFIPHLLAISASSPFWQGDNTGLSSCRPTTYESLPTAGQPYQSDNWQGFERLCHSLKKCNAIESLHDLWWDIRPSPAYGTLEIRACDGPANLQEASAIIAFIHLLAHWFSEKGRDQNLLSHFTDWIARENKWRAIRHGLNCNIVINENGDTKSIKKDILEWIERLAPYTKKLGYKRYIDDLKNIIKNGNSSSRQLAVYAKNNSLKDVVKFNIEEFKKRKSIFK